jgi:hypothetical protein
MASIANLTVTLRASKMLRLFLGLLRLLVQVRVALPELLTTAALLGGWTLITAAIAALTSPLAWLFSGGLLLISLGGWKLLWALASNGLYTLIKAKPTDG